MAKDPATKDPKPLTERELQSFLLWLFNETGTSCQVEAWRKSKEKPAPAAATPGAGDDE
jgi:hypothetical protein